LEPRVFNAGPALIQALFAGEIDVGYVGPGPVLAANERTAGRGIRVIAGGAANGVVVVARRDSDIRSMKDLAGRRVATPQQGNTQDISARHYLQGELHQSDLSNVMAVSNAEQSALMARGQIDAAWVPEPWGARLIAETGARLVAEEKDLWPGGRFALTVVVTTPEFLAAHPDVVEKLLAVHHRWTERLRADPGKYAPELAKALVGLTGKDLPAGVTEQALRRVEFTDDPLPETFGRMGEWSYELGFLRREPRLDRLTDTGILRRVAAAAGPTTRP
jgi:NitT/TauT family transport system substrate-binding protein